MNDILKGVIRRVGGRKSHPGIAPGSVVTNQLVGKTGTQRKDAPTALVTEALLRVRPRAGVEVGW